MRITKWISGALICVALVAGCDTPASPAGSTKVVPYVAGHLTENYNGTRSDFSLYLAEGKQTGPSITDAEVFFDGVKVSMGSHGYYYLYNGRKLEPGSSYKVTVRHPNFETIDADLVVPTGAPSGIAVESPPSDWYQPLDTTVEKSFTVSSLAEGGVWSDVVLRAVGYDQFSYRRISYLFQPSGTSPQVCTLGVGWGTFVGFEVRKQNLVVPPGTALASQLSVEGIDIQRAGYDPLQVSPTEATLSLRFDGESMRASASFRGTNSASATAQEVAVTGNALSPSTDFTYFSATWSASAPAEGTEIPYSFKDVEGRVVSGTVSWHTEDYVLPVSSPAKGSLTGATQVSFPAPSGGWPSNVVIYAVIKQNSTTTYHTSRYGYGTTPIEFQNSTSGYDLGTAESVEFRGVLETQLPIPGYRGQIILGGAGALW